MYLIPYAIQRPISTDPSWEVDQSSQGFISAIYLNAFSTFTLLSFGGHGEEGADIDDEFAELNKFSGGCGPLQS